MNNNLIPIQYIGKQPRKTDNVCDTNFVWEEHGEVQMVPPDIAARYLNYPDVWRVEPQWQAQQNVGAAAPAPAPATAPVVPQPAAFTGTREEQVAQAIHFLMERRGENDFTRPGLPNVMAIEGLVGYNISAQERNAAWESIESPDTGSGSDGSGGLSGADGAE